MIVVSSARFVEHQTPPGHPESPDRNDVFEVAAAKWRKRGGAIIEPRPATDDELARVHSASHLARMAETAGRSTALDVDTFTSPESYEIARLAAGASAMAVEIVMKTADRQALVLSRPPGHHAERDRAMGFCFFNNVAVAAAHARTLGAERVAIVDYDVHHGNGTQHIFEADPHVLYLSTHQFPYYPGTGDASEVGEGDGRGFTVNVPLEVGATDDDYRLAFDQVVTPIVGQFKPDLILVSAGFDAHERDPLGGMRLTTPSFGAMTAALRGLADAHCDGRIVAVSEGGYDLRALHDSIVAAIDALASADSPASRWPSATRASSRGAQGVRAARSAQASFWSL
jgi:acetoin utilization deacetylase AcuC-like enzyme